MQRRIANGVLLAIIVLLGGCDGLVSPSHYGAVEVEAVSRDGDPVPAVGLLLYTGPRPMGYGSTDAAGRATFAQVPEGDYAIRAVPTGDWVFPAAGAGALVSYAGVAVRPDSTHVVRFVLVPRKSGSIVVRVTDDAGVARAGVSVTSYDVSAIYQTLLTDTSGEVEFSGLAVGEYGVIVRPPAGSGLTPAERYHDGIRITVPGESRSLTVVLTRASP